MCRPAGPWQGHHGAKWHPNLYTSYRSQKALRLLNSTVASQEPHKHHDGSNRNQDVDSCKEEQEANTLLQSFVWQHPSTWPDMLAPWGR